MPVTRNNASEKPSTPTQAGGIYTLDQLAYLGGVENHPDVNGLTEAANKKQEEMSALKKRLSEQPGFSPEILSDIRILVNPLNHNNPVLQVLTYAVMVSGQNQGNQQYLLNTCFNTMLWNNIELKQFRNLDMIFSAITIMNGGLIDLDKLEEIRKEFDHSFIMENFVDLIELAVYENGMLSNKMQALWMPKMNRSPAF